MNIEDKPLAKVDWNLGLRFEHQAVMGETWRRSQARQEARTLGMWRRRFGTSSWAVHWDQATSCSSGRHAWPLCGKGAFSPYWR